MVPVIVSNVLPIMTIPIFTRILTVEDYGVFALVMVYATFVSGISNFGLQTGFERNFFEDNSLRKKVDLLFSTLLFVLFILLIFLVLTFIFKRPLSNWIVGCLKYGNILFLALCARGIISIKSYYLIFFKNVENARAFVLYTVIESLLATFLSLFMVAYLRIGVIGLIWAQLIAGALIFLTLSTKFIYSYPFNIDASALKSSLRLSLPLTPRIFLGIISKEFDKYMIGMMSTLGAVGVYGLGQRIANITLTIMTAIQNVYAPQVYKRMFQEGEEAKQSIGTYLTPFFFISILVAFLVALFNEELILILTPEPYHGAIDIISIFCMFYGTIFFAKQPQLVYAKKTGIISILSLVGIILNIALNIPFINRWGSIGAAWATFLAGLITGFISFYLSQKYYRIKWEKVKIASILLLFFFSVMISILFRHYEIIYMFRLSTKVLCLMGVILLGTKLDIINKQTFILIKGALVSKKNNIRA